MTPLMTTPAPMLLWSPTSSVDLSSDQACLRRELAMRTKLEVEVASKIRVATVEQESRPHLVAVGAKRRLEQDGACDEVLSEARGLQGKTDRRLACGSWASALRTLRPIARLSAPFPRKG